MMAGRRRPGTRPAVNDATSMCRVFFYGLFMDQALLVAKGLHPRIVGPALLRDYRIHIGDRATLLPSDSSRAYGIVMELAAREASTLYSEPSVRAYRRVGVHVEMLKTGETAEAHCYILPDASGLAGANPGYATELSRLAQALGLDAEYAREIGAFAR